MFFLITGSIQLIPGISPTSPIGTILPLIIILIFTLRKEIVEDSKRHKLDYSVNHTHTLVLEKGMFVQRLWKDVKVGDLVKVKNNQNFPSDLIIVCSCEDEGQCYIETSNLDGETNLKIRQALPETKDLKTESQLSQFKGTVKSELPNNSLYTFDAAMIINGNQYPLTPDQLLLRGSQLRNTDWIVGLACFTGHETKLVMNSTSTPVKKTKIELMVNDQIIFLHLVLLILAVSCATLKVYIQVLFYI
jgi:phospholipid-transporting ATPase